MLDWDDYHAFISTSSSDSNSDNSSGGSGYSGNIIMWIVIILGVLWLIGELFS